MVKRILIILPLLLFVLLVVEGLLGCRPELGPQSGDSRLSYRVLDIEKLAQIKTLSVRPVSFAVKQDVEIWKQFFEDVIAGVWEKETSLEILSIELEGAAQSAVADAELQTNVSFLQERVGSNMGALKGARLMFSQRIVLVKTQQEIWRATYVYSDQALTENILQAHSGKWERVGDILRKGVSEAAQSVDAALRQFYSSK